ncbi:MAG TPA: hypothetical protein VKK79_19605 [Candidatus Lokiarchaeia archaeon]|nr:hypothetical protein [Candidatus Lokiarchaeia archaeon]
MAILEAGLIFEGLTLVARKYYSSDIELNDQLRAGLLAALSSFANVAFKDNIETFTLSRYEIVCTGKSISMPRGDKKANLLAFGIIEKGTNNKMVRNKLTIILEAFLNRFSILDIAAGELGKFEPFRERIDQIFADLRLKSEDRAKSLFG